VIDVTNTLVRSSPTPEQFSRYVALEPCGLLGPVRLILKGGMTVANSHLPEDQFHTV